MRKPLLLAAGLVLALSCSTTVAQEEKEPEIITRLKKAKVEGPFTLVVVMKVKEGQEKNFKKTAGPCLTASRKEKGCQQYDLMEDLENPRQFVMIERWKSVKDLEDHFKTDHFKKLVSQVHDMFDGQPRFAFFRKADQAKD
jgi:quinol monooxygenase YgiN